jgi:hypothetical protein
MESIRQLAHAGIGEHRLGHDREGDHGAELEAEHVTTGIMMFFSTCTPTMRERERPLARAKRM